MTVCGRALFSSPRPWERGGAAASADSVDWGMRPVFADRPQGPPSPPLRWCCIGGIGCGRTVLCWRSRGMGCGPFVSAVPVLWCSPLIKAMQDPEDIAVIEPSLGVCSDGHDPFAWARHGTPFCAAMTPPPPGLHGVRNNRL